MCGRYDSRSHRQRATAYALHSKELECYAASYHVNDRVYRPDLVEGYVLRRTIMHGTLRLRQKLESLHGSPRCSLREACALYEPPDVGECAMGMLLRVLDSEAEGAYPADLDGFDVDLERYVELL